MNTTATGRAAEEVAAAFLQNKGFKIVAQNWRTRWCEVDIIAKQLSVVYLVEVKYRASTAWGSGFDYITPRKIQQMHFSAEVWKAQHNWLGDYCLAAIELTDNPPQVSSFIKDISFE